jgi:hypothetical protein
MEIADPLIITAIGSLTGAIVILFHRSEKCLADRDKQAKRIDSLERAIYGCPVVDCPNKPAWKAPITTTLSCSNNAQKIT